MHTTGPSLMKYPDQSGISPIAVIGMSGRFPGATNVRTYWENLISGRETISHFAQSELEYDVTDISTCGEGGSIVNARGILENVDLFDAEFFDILPREAELMDPQHRFFLECAWEALESAGYCSENFNGLIGVYAGTCLNTYLLANLVKDRGYASDLTGQYQAGRYDVVIGNDKDFLPMRVAYKLNLRGPAYTVQSACSTSLVAVCQAAQSLLNYQCDMALAGGSSITFPQKRNYQYQDGAILSRTGQIRAFDVEAHGTVFGHGVGVVLLKRLEDAIADGDSIAAILKGFAVNNDGSDKVSFTAPSVQGQARVIADALALASVHPDTVSYVEAHGTGTPLGDPIEVAALTEAFRSHGSRGVGYCGIGTVKPNIGHLDVAAGIAGMIKVILSLKHKKIPPTLHFVRPNPQIDFANSPFYPVSKLTEWRAKEGPLRAGVSSIGAGGTNAHVILEEAPTTTSEPACRSEQLLLLSARTTMALDAATANLAEHLRCGPEDATNLADIAYTLQVGRRRFAHRRYFVCRDKSQALNLLSDPQLPLVTTTRLTVRAESAFFLFPGQGTQVMNIGRGLYESEEVFRSAIDACAHIFRRHFCVDFRKKIYSSNSANDDARSQRGTAIAPLATFSVEYALSQLWISWGLVPNAVLGYDVGEYVAAVIAEVLSLEEALRLLVTKYPSLFEALTGSMAEVPVSDSPVEGRSPKGLFMASGHDSDLPAVPDLQVESRPLSTLFTKRDVPTKHNSASDAFRSSSPHAILNEHAEVSETRRRCPKIPWLSARTGNWIVEEELDDFGYWREQACSSVAFPAVLDRILATADRRLFLEVGPGEALTTLVRQKLDCQRASLTVASLPHPENWKTDVQAVLHATGAVWAAGLELNWNAVNGNRARKRVCLPTYPFERKRFWIEPPQARNSDKEIGAGHEADQDAAHALERVTYLGMLLKDIISEISCVEKSQINESSSFVELGFDSLFLTQLSLACRKRFGVEVTFRQIFSELGCIRAMAKHLDEHLPQNSWQPQASPDPNTRTTAHLSPCDSPMVRDTSVVNASEDELTRDTLSRIILKQREILQQLEGLTARTGLYDCRSIFAPPKWLGVGEQPRLRHAELLRATDVVLSPDRIRPAFNRTPAQREALNELIAKYCRKTASSKKYAETHHAHFADPRAVAGFKLDFKEMVYPIVAAKSSGSKIWDLDNNEYIDVTMGFGSVFFGHSPDWITSQLHKQLDSGIEIGPQSRLAGEVARLICDFTGMDRATFCNTGSEAVMGSLRLARTVTGRDKVVIFNGAYHGTFDEVLARSVVVNGQFRTQPIAPGIPNSLIENLIILEYGSRESLKFIQNGAISLAAVLVEPVQSRNPENQPRDFLHELRRITHDSGTALIFDETVTGFRCHPGGAQAWFGIDADICTYGKILGGGIPIGVIAGRSKWMDPLDGGEWHFGDDSFPATGVTYFAGTFVRHPLAMMAAHTVLLYLKNSGPSLQQTLNHRVEKLVRRLNDYLQNAGVPIRLCYFSSFFVIKYSSELPDVSLLWYYLREKGIHIWEGRPCFFTTAHTEKDFNFFADAFQETIEHMQSAGFIPAGDRNAKVGSDERSDGTEAENNGKVVRVSDAMKEIWLATKFGEEASLAFNESTSIFFIGELDLYALDHALHEIVERHEALRSTFSRDGSTMHIKHRIDLDIPVVDLRKLNAEESSRTLAALRAKESRRVFDLMQGPLLTAKVVLISERQSVLLFTAHHIACDGWSYNILLEELGALYTAYVHGKTPQLPEPVQISQYIEWERNLRASLAYARHEQYWTSQYRTSAPLIDLPFAAPRPEIRTFDGSREYHQLPLDLCLSLREFSKARGTTLFAVLLAGYQTMLCRLTRASDLVVGIPYAGQNSLQNSRLVGHCANILPLRLSFDTGMSFRDFVQLVQHAFLEAYEHRDFTFSLLIQKLNNPNDRSRVPIVSLIFNLDPTVEGVKFQGLSHRIELNPRFYFQFDLALSVVQEQDFLRVECDFNSNLYNNAAIKQFLCQYESVLREATADPEHGIL